MDDRLWYENGWVVNVNPDAGLGIKATRLGKRQHLFPEIVSSSG